MLDFVFSLFLECCSYIYDSLLFMLGCFCVCGLFSIVKSILGSLH